jgi:hypothetical protein
MNSKNSRVGPYGVLHGPIDIKEPDYELPESEKKRKSEAERMDKEGMMYSGKTAVEQGDNFITPPPNVAEYVEDGLDVAKTPPEVEFAVVPYAYRFFEVPQQRNVVGPWSTWGQAVYHKSSGSFYAATGDHGTYNAHLHLIKYNTESRKIECLPDINKQIGRTKEQFGDGKIHGFLDFYKPHYLDKEHLWFCTYWCKYPEPTEKDYATGYEGGYVMSYNPVTGDLVDYGVPMPRASWPYHRVDTQRGLMFGVGYFNEFLVWDIEKQQSKWAGYPPSGKTWYNRCMLVDEHTGFVYSNNTESLQKKLLKYDPGKNRIFELDCGMPRNSRSGSIDPIRCHTRERGQDGLIWGVSGSGEIYSFDPDKERLEGHGPAWPGWDSYVCTIDRSPGGRYLYYTIAAHSRAYLYGSPVIQYDLHTGKAKALAFLFQDLYDKYGYIAGGSYAIKLDVEGKKLFMIWNGDFTDVAKLRAKPSYDPADTTKYGVPGERDAFGHVSAIVVNIPESERLE